MNRFRRTQILDDADLALNLSYVLHEHSASAAVCSATRAINAHTRSLAPARAGLVPALLRPRLLGGKQGRYTILAYRSRGSTHRQDGCGQLKSTSEDVQVDIPSGIAYWLTATIGLPDRLPDALGMSPDTIARIDACTDLQQPHQFFRAPAELSLPDWPETKIGVAALVLRPDRRTNQLIATGPFEWPTEQRAAFRAIEQIIQAHLGQWMPPRALWSAPAEVLLPDEVYLGSDDASRMS